MPALVWTVLCNRPIVDDDSKLISLIDAVETLNVQADEEFLSNKKGILTLDCSLVSMWRRRDEKDGDEVPLKASIIGPQSKKALLEVGIVFQFTEGNQNARTIFKLTHLPVGQGEGTYNFELRVGKKGEKGKISWKLASRTPLDVNVNEASAKH